MLQAIQHYIGWRNWAVFRYNSVFENFFVLLIIALLQQAFHWNFVLRSLVFILFSILATTYGYLINDYSDSELDRQHGKPNTFEKDSAVKARMVLLGVLLLFVVAGIPFWNQPYFLPLIALWFMITTFYSLPPIRLKERGALNIVFVAMAQRLLPILILFSAFDFWEAKYVLPISVYVLLRGLSSDINHQLEDYKNDVKTGTRTFAVSMGYQRVEKLFNVNLHLEKIMLAVLLVQFSLDLRFSAIVLNGLWRFTAALYFLALFWFMLDKRQWQANPFDVQSRSLSQFLHHAYPSVGLPLMLNVILSILYFPFTLLLIFQIVIRRLYSPETISGNFLVRFLIQKLGGK
ncbi:UbiA family prenyltransferase [Calditrichota bacterium LG25]